MTKERRLGFRYKNAYGVCEGERVACHRPSAVRGLGCNLARA